MKLGVDTHFAQGWSLDWHRAAVDIRSDSLRDSIYWRKVELAPGQYDFSDPSLAWLRMASEQDSRFTLLFGDLTNPLYDANGTINSPAAIAAFAEYVVAVLREFPSIERIEIGNEFNSQSFVSGTLKTAPITQRDEAYAAIVKAVDAAIETAGLDVAILGGAAHSIPVDWFKDLATSGALDVLDGIVIHPYTSEPEQLADQLAVLRGALGGRELPIEVTEFGGDFATPDDVPAFLAKMVSVMAAAGVDEAHWYALAKQKWFPNMELFDQATDQLSPAGKTFAVLQDLLDLGPVTQLATDSTSYAFAFGTGAVVLWGEERALTLASGVRAFDLAGNAINGIAQISFDRPVILKADGAAGAPADWFILAPDHSLADSYHDFDVINPVLGDASGYEGPWSYYSLTGEGKMSALQTMGGGLRAGELWTPYIGSPWLRPLRVDSETINPVDFAAGTKPSASYAIVERFTATAAGRIEIKGHWDVKDSSEDGIVLLVKHNGSLLLEQTIFDPETGHVFDLALRGVTVQAGDTIDFIVTPRGNSRGSDLTDRWIGIYEVPQVFEAPPTPEKSGEEVKFGLADPLDGESDRVTITLGKQNPESAPVSVAITPGAIDSETPIAVPLPIKQHEAVIAPSDPWTGYNKITVTQQLGKGTDGADRIDASLMKSAVRLLGGDGDDWLIGGPGGDVLEGQGGVDILQGGPGHDRYTVSEMGDTIIELPDGGNDLVDSYMNFVLPDNVESLRLRGEADLSGSGNSLRNVIHGNDGANVIEGKGGNDVLFGKKGADTLIGGAGDDMIFGGPDADTFVFEQQFFGAGKDRIRDFVSGEDKIAIHLSSGAEPKLENARVASTEGEILLYTRSTGKLYYDEDGSGPSAPVLVAEFSGMPQILASDLIAF